MPIRIIPEGHPPAPENLLVDENGKPISLALTQAEKNRIERDSVNHIIQQVVPDEAPKKPQKTAHPADKNRANGLADMVARLEPEDDRVSIAHSVAAITDAIPGAVLGDERNLRKLLAEKRLTPEQHKAFEQGGKILYREMMRNPEQWGAIMDIVDLNGDKKVNLTELSAYAAAIDDRRTFGKVSFDELAAELTKPGMKKIALQYRDALANEPFELPADARPGKNGLDMHAEQGPLAAQPKPRTR